jgi:plastocyanin
MVATRREEGKADAKDAELTFGLRPAGDAGFRDESTLFPKSRSEPLGACARSSRPPHLLEHMSMTRLRLLLLGLVGALCALSLAGAAAPATVAVKLTANGFEPGAVTVHAGDAVTWTNNDTGVRTIVSAQAGFAEQNLIPGASYTFTFTKVGKFRVDAPGPGKQKAQMFVTVDAAPVSVALTAPKTLVVYGNGATLAGTVSTLQANEQVTILAKPCGATAATKVATVATTTGGVYAALVKPLKNTLYTAQAKTATSPGVTVLAKPKLTLTRPAKGRFALVVRGAISFSGRAVVLQRWNATLKRWVNVKSALLVRGPAATAPTILSKATFRATVKARTRLRVSISQFQAGACYRAAVSNVVLA